MKSTGEGLEIKERWKFILQFYREILGHTFTLFLFLLPLSLSFLSLVFSFLPSPSSLSLYKKTAGEAARWISVFHTLISHELSDLLLKRFLWLNMLRKSWVKQSSKVSLLRTVSIEMVFNRQCIT